jgi:N-acetylneuraminic acid mutarotase
MSKNLRPANIFWLSLALLFTLTGFSQNWTWMKGANTINVLGTYGTQGTSAPTNVPGSREGAYTWTDVSGNLWLFGGNGHCSFVYGRLNDLWKYNTSTNEWTWVNGPDNVNQAGVCGTMGTGASTNIPGSRAYGVTWADASGNLWLFGGYGYDIFGNQNDLNDLWKYTISTNQWTWVNGPNSAAGLGVYGTQSVGSSTNTPGARRHSTQWKDASGNFWLFGGYGFDAYGTESRLNDLWKYNPTSGTWTWIKGNNFVDQNGTYGTLGTASSTNAPGSRYGSVSWADNSGNLWLFAGYGNSAGGVGYMNDVWKYNVSANQWTWMKGSSVESQPGVYGTQTIPSASNTPGGRHLSTGWSDASGNLYVWGGNGLTNSYGVQNTNEFWKFDIATSQWTWIRGPYWEVAGIYNTQGTASADNDPGSGYFRQGWKDNSGNFWMFGGNGYDVNSNWSVLGDLWKMNPCLPISPVNVATWATQNVCTGMTATLSALSGTNAVVWYSSPTSTTALGTGSTYVTSSLTSGTLTTAGFTYYAASTNTCGASAARSQIVVTSNSIYPYVTAGSYNTVTISIPYGSTPNSDWYPWVYSFTDPVPAGNTIIGIDLNCDVVDQGWGGSGMPADIQISDQRVGFPTLTHSWASNSFTTTAPFPNYVYGGTNTFKMYFAGWPGWQGFINNAVVRFRYQNKTPAPITACSASSITLKAYGAVSYTWSGGFTDGMPHVVGASQIYTVTGANAYGCTDNATISVISIPSPTLSITGPTAVCIGSSVTKTVSGATTYTWDQGANTTTIALTPTMNAIYTVTGSATNGCDASLTTALVVNPVPVISVNSGSICSGKTFTIVPSGATTYTYSGGSNIVSPSATTSYSVSGANSYGCAAALPAISNLTVFTTPTVSINSGAICAGNAFTLVPTGAFAYTLTGNSTVISPTVTGSYSLTGMSSAGCLSTNTAVSTVVVNPLPLVSITGPTAICTGSSATQTANNANTYTWSTGSNATSIVVNPIVTATYTLTGTNTLTGCFNSITKQLLVENPPVLTVNSGNVCAGGVFTMVPSGAATYTFSSGSSTVTPLVNTSYFVSGTSALGCVSSASAISNVVVNPSPVISVNSGAICSGSSFTMVPTGANTYTFTGGGPVVGPSANTSYSVTGTNVLGCVSAAPAVANVTVNPLPVISANNGTVCSGSVYTIVPSGAATYTYSSGSPMVTPSSNTTYSIFGTSAQGCISSNTAVITVSVNPVPSISVGSGTICEGSLFVLNPSGGLTYTYSGGSASVNPLVSTTYSVTGTNAFGCVSPVAAISNVTVYPAPVVSVNSATICEGQTFTIIPTGAASYSFSGGSNVVSPLVTTFYAVLGVSPLGCVSTNPAMSSVVVKALPGVVINGLPAICSGQINTISASGANSYTWSTNATVPTITVSPLVNTVYTVMGLGANGCAGSASLSVEVNPIPAITVNSGSICPGSIFHITPGGALTYTYSGGTNVVSPLVTTSYSVTGTDANGCISTMPAVSTVSVINFISISVSGQTAACAGSAVSLTVTGAGNYNWSTGDIADIITPTPTANTTYTVIGFDGTCSDTAYISVTVNMLPAITLTTSSQVICMGENVTLTASGAATYTWNTGGSGAVIVVSPSINATYTVIGEDANTCTNQTVLHQLVNPCTDVESLAKNDILSVYPNPNTGAFTIEASHNIKIYVINMLGEIIEEKNISEGKTNIEMNHACKGVYFIKMREGSEINVTKIIIQ